MNATIRRNTDFYSATIPIIISVLSVYLTIGITLGILPEYIRFSLKYGSMAVGMVIGLQALATLLTRAYAGKITDMKGAKLSSRIGGGLVMLAGILYLTAPLFSPNVVVVLGIILISRIVHGVSESFVVTGALTWAIGLVGAEKSGRVMTWNGIAMYAGIAIGAPLGIWLSKSFGIEAAFGFIIILSIVSWLAPKKLPELNVETVHKRMPFSKVVSKISGPGMVLGLSSIGFVCISSFVTLFFVQNHWGDASLAFMLFGGFYVLVRIFFSTFPDKYGAYKVAFVSLLIEVAGQLMLMVSTSKVMAMIGCSLTGAGFSLIFPSLGVLVVKKVTPQMRGTALGAYAAFFDLSLGMAAPIAGLLASWYNYESVYFFGGISCAIAIMVLVFGKNREA